MSIELLSRSLAGARRLIERARALGADRSAALPRKQLQGLFQRYPGARRDLVHLAQLERHLEASLSAAGLPALVIEHALDEVGIAMADGRATDVLALRAWLRFVFSAQVDSQLSSTSWAPTAFMNSSRQPGSDLASCPPSRREAKRKT